MFTASRDSLGFANGLRDSQTARDSTNLPLARAPREYCLDGDLKEIIFPGCVLQVRFNRPTNATVSFSCVLSGPILISQVSNKTIARSKATVGYKVAKKLVSGVIEIIMQKLSDPVLYASHAA